MKNIQKDLQKARRTTAQEYFKKKKKKEDSLEAKYKALQGGSRLLHSTSEATGELLQTYSGQQRVIPLVVK